MPPPQARHLQQGKDLYNANDLAGAYSQFKLATKHCRPCSGSKADKVCPCKDFLKAIREKSLNEELKKPCVCDARSNQRCSNADHMASLRFLAAIESRARKFKSGMLYAQKMISISPRDPTGYLQLGKLLRLDHEPGLALEVYNQGIENIQRKQRKQPDHPHLKDLRTQAEAVAKALWKGDPLERFPHEVAVEVLRYMDFRKLCQCLRVSKKWRDFLTSNAATTLWLQQRYYNPKGKSAGKYFSQQSFHTYLAKYARGKATSVEIIDCCGFKLTTSQTMTGFLRYCPQLQHLTLRGPRGWSLPLPTTWLPMRHLKSLYLGVGMMQEMNDHDFLWGMLRMASRTLEELSIFDLVDVPKPPFVDVPESPCYEDLWPKMPKLRTLRISTVEGVIDLDWIMRCSPDVRSFWFHHARVRSIELDTSRQGERPRWPNLEQVFISDIYNLWPSFPAFPAGLTEFYFDPCCLPVPVFEGPPSKLRKIWLARDLFFTWNIDDLKAIIEPSLRSGSLRELAVDPMSWEWAHSGTAPEEGPWDWLQNESVGVLCMRNVTRSSGVGCDPDRDLLLLVKKFAGLHTLDIGDEPISPAALIRVLKETGVTTVYHQHGFAFQEARDAAMADGSARIIHGAYPGVSFMHECARRRRYVPGQNRLWTPLGE